MATILTGVPRSEAPRIITPLQMVQSPAFLPASMQGILAMHPLLSHTLKLPPAMRLGAPHTCPRTISAMLQTTPVPIKSLRRTFSWPSRCQPLRPRSSSRGRICSSLSSCKPCSNFGTRMPGGRINSRVAACSSSSSSHRPQGNGHCGRSASAPASRASRQAMRPLHPPSGLPALQPQLHLLHLPPSFLPSPGTLHSDKRQTPA